MKKRITLVLVLSLLFTTACAGTSYPEIEKAIEDIGKVKLDDEQRIRRAEAMLYALADEEQKKVNNKQALFEAREKYNEMSRDVKTLDEDILRLGKVDPDKSSQAKELMSTYKNMDADSKAHVKNIDALEKYLSALEVLEEEVKLSELEVPVNVSNCDEIANKAFKYLETCTEEKNRLKVQAIAINALMTGARQAQDQGDLDTAIAYLDRIPPDFSEAENYDNAMFMRRQIFDATEKMQPENGEIILGSLKGYGRGKLWVYTDEWPVLVKMCNIDDTDSYIFFFVERNSVAEIRIRDGDYLLDFATGEMWFDEEILFGRNTEYYRCNKKLEYATLEGSKELNLDYKVDLRVKSDFGENFYSIEERQF